MNKIYTVHTNAKLVRLMYTAAGSVRAAAASASLAVQPASVQIASML